jgi:hypothetical protein
MKKLTRIAANLGFAGALALWGFLLYKRGKDSAFRGPVFGVRSEWERFVSKYPTLAERLARLNGTMARAFP